MDTQVSRSRMQSVIGLALCGSLLLAAIIACSRSRSNCTATLTYQGRTYTGADAKEEKAVSNACN